MERIAMNTESLQKNFPDVYRDFFSRNDLVVSGCFSFPWGPGGFGHRSDFMFITNKLPLKCYVGIKIIKERKISFNGIMSYNICNKNFESHAFKDINKEETILIENIRNLLDLLNFKKGIEIEILSETTRGHSFGFSGTFFGILSLGLHVLGGKLNKNDIVDYNNFTTTNIFKEIYNFGWELEYKSRYGNTIGQTLINTMLNTENPIYVFSEKFNKNQDIGKIAIEYKNIVDKYESSIVNSGLPFDYLMIYSGLATDTKDVELYKKGDENYLSMINDYILNDIIFDTKIETRLKKILSNNNIYNHFIDNISILSGITIYFFKELFERGYDENLIENFIDHINGYRYMTGIIEKQTTFAEDIVYLFSKNRKKLNEKIGVMPVYSGKNGGGYLIVLKSGISRETINMTIQDLKLNYPNIEMEYSSYLDGKDNEGIAIEQFISEGFFSEYIQKDKVILKNSEGESKLIDYKKISEENITGFLFDTISNKIFFNGEKLTSKDIPSQNTTVEVMNVLIENIGIEVSNKSFSSSSYSKNKNEMQGKIVTPLIRTLEEKTGNKLPLICKGSLTDYYLKLNTPINSLSIIIKI